MASYIAQVNIGGTLYPVGSSLYGTCDTAGIEEAKIVSMDSFDTLVTGTTIFVKFANANMSLTDCTMKVGSVSAKPIYTKGNPATAENAPWKSGDIIAFTYDGQYWQIVGGVPKTYSTLTREAAAALQESNTTSVLISQAALKTAIDTKINALDVNSISGFGTGKTLKTLTETNGKIAATFQDISITKSQVSDLGTIGQAAAKNVDTVITANSTSTNVPTTAAVADFVDGAVSGLTGAMHLIGTTTTALTDGDTIATVTIDGQTVTPEAGDVVLYAGKEFVWDSSSWELLGDEGSYALKTSTTQVGSASGWSAGSATSLTKTDVSIPNVTSAGTAPTLTKTDVSIPNVTSAGSATTASVASGTLTITNGSAPTIGSAISATHIDSWSAGTATTLGTAISATHIDSYTAGTAPTLTVVNTTVVKP